MMKADNHVASVGMGWDGIRQGQNLNRSNGTWGWSSGVYLYCSESLFVRASMRSSYILSITTSVRTSIPIFIKTLCEELHNPADQAMLQCSKLTLDPSWPNNRKKGDMKETNYKRRSSDAKHE